MARYLDRGAPDDRVETVLSSPKYRRLIEKAKVHGFEICFVFIFLRDAELQLERIRARVAKGGHDVPPDKVLDRRTRSFEQAGWFFWRADRAWLFDNSGSEPELVGRKDGARTRLSSGLPLDLMKSVVAGSA